MTPTPSDKHRVAIVIPAYNEETNIQHLRKRFAALFQSIDHYDFQLIIVDDHSSDRTYQLVREWANEDSRVRLIRLSRNCGSHAAFHAGLVHAPSADVAVFLAADLQDPPELIPDMLSQWQEGSAVVWAIRAAREGEKLRVRLFSRLYYRVLRGLSGINVPPQGADFFLIDRKVIDAYLAIPEKNTSFMCMVLWMGFPQSFVPYVKQERSRGTSKWTLSKKVKLFVDSIVSFSFMPIRLMSWLGVLFAIAGFGFAAYVILARLLGYIVAGAGYAALMTTLLIGFGLVMLMLGVIGEYLWRTFDEARGRPRFIVESRYPDATEDDR